MKVIEHNIQTGEEIERPMNPEELKEWQEQKALAEALLENKQKEASSRQALLEKLGITEEEAKLLLGGN